MLRCSLRNVKHSSQGCSLHCQQDLCLDGSLSELTNLLQLWRKSGSDIVEKRHLPKDVKYDFSFRVLLRSECGSFKGQAAASCDTVSERTLEARFAALRVQHDIIISLASIRLLGCMTLQRASHCHRSVAEQSQRPDLCVSQSLGTRCPDARGSTSRSRRAYGQECLQGACHFPVK